MRRVLKPATAARDFLFLVGWHFIRPGFRKEFRVCGAAGSFRVRSKVRGRHVGPISADREAGQGEAPEVKPTTAVMPQD